MKFVNQRQYRTKNNRDGNYTLGLLQCDFDPFTSFILEDGFNEVKIAGVTRFKAGLYKLVIRKELTNLTIRHREAYAKNPDGWWFKANPDWFHIEIADIPNYKFCYVHSGIDDSHTDGCNLPSYAFDLSKTDNPGSKSVRATNDFYALTYPLLLEGKTIFWETRDEPTLW